MLNQDDLKRLAAVSGACLTIFQPLRDEPVLPGKANTCILGAIQQADRLLAEKGMGETEREEMLRPLLKVASKTDWTGRRGSAVIFRAPDFTLVNFWPDALPHRVHLAGEFLVLPLLPGLLSKRDFWLLALSIKAVRLFRGSSHGLVEVALPAGVPRSLAEEEGFDRPDHSLRNRSSAGRSVGRMKGVQFGTSSARELKSTYLHDFFKAIDRGVHPVLMEDKQPLILAGITRELAIYRQVNSYAPMLSGAVYGSPDSLGTEVLYTEAARLMSAYSEWTMHGTQMHVEEAANRHLALTDPTAVIEAASNGQVDELIVSPEAPGLGKREEEINWAALATIREAGRISVLNGPQMASGVAAILRFRKISKEGHDTVIQHATENEILRS